jgi:hypothetical protein
MTYVSIIISWTICLLHLVYFYVSKFEAFHFFVGFFLACMPFFLQFAKFDFMNEVDIFNKCLIVFFSYFNETLLN